METTTVDPSEPFYWDAYRDTTVGRYLFQREYAFIRRCLGQDSRTHSLLDLGCGSGRLTMPLRDAGYTIVGMDLSPVALAALRTQTREVRLVRGDTRHLPFAAGSFDGVVGIQTLDYVELDAFMRECGRTLALRSADLDYREVLRAARDHDFEVRAVSGYTWLPFTRHSDSTLVRAAALVASALRLDRSYEISPKILVAARRGRS
ncbi:MAG: class I SAM-dependent methyltransferase [Chloroflexota bacterium]|nr:class I SAM-dependent methyltransferase [Chloroflexota bacterium]